VLFFSYTIHDLLQEMVSKADENAAQTTACMNSDDMQADDNGKHSQNAGFSEHPLSQVF
jgi:hypothetical protein